MDPGRGVVQNNRRVPSRERGQDRRWVQAAKGSKQGRGPSRGREKVQWEEGSERDPDMGGFRQERGPGSGGLQGEGPCRGRAQERQRRGPSRGEVKTEGVQGVGMK